MEKDSHISATTSQADSDDNISKRLDWVIDVTRTTLANFVSSVQTIGASDVVFANPCLKMTAPIFTLGEFDELFEFGPGKHTRAYLGLEPMMGWTASRIASILLADEQETRMYLSPIVVLLLTIDNRRGVDDEDLCDRCGALMDKFDMLLDQRLEACA